MEYSDHLGASHVYIEINMNNYLSANVNATILTYILNIYSYVLCIS